MIKLFPNGSKEYYNLEGQLHKLSGPAVIYKYSKNIIFFDLPIPLNLTIENWYYNDMYIPVKSQEEFDRHIKLLAFL